MKLKKVMLMAALAAAIGSVNMVTALADENETETKMRLLPEKQSTAGRVTQKTTGVIMTRTETSQADGSNPKRETDAEMKYGTISIRQPTLWSPTPQETLAALIIHLVTMEAG